MESDPREPLLAGIGENPRTDECSGPGADISKRTQTSPRRSPPLPPPPPPPPPPRRSLLGLRIAKNPRTDECSGSGADISERTQTSPRRSPPPPPPPPPPRRSLLGSRIAKNPRTDECSGSGADISERTQTSPRCSPPPPSPPLRSLLGLGSKKQVIFSSSPSLPAHGIAMNHPASSPSPSLAGGFDSDPEAPPCRTPQHFAPAASSSRGGVRNSDGAQISSPVSTTTPPSNREGLVNETSSSPSSASRWNLFGRLRRRAPPHLPLSAPRGSGPFDVFRKTIKELRQKGAQLDSVGVERVIGIFGFSLFGSLSLFPYTIDRVKDFATLRKSIVLFIFGLIWVLGSVGVLSGLLGKTDFEQAFCRFTGRLGVVGLAFLVIFHVWWTLPSDNNYCTAGFYVLLALAFLLHILSWGMSLLVGEDRIEEASDAQD